MRYRLIENAWPLVVAAALLPGCAEERDPVDRVQPYALDKSFFVGEDFADTTDDPEFYSRNHIIDIGYGATGASQSLFTASWAEPVGRIKWQITEDYLIARSAYERIEGSDGKGDPERDINGRAVGSATNDGIIVAMFAIESHFDIVNDYNPTTGEKLNVIIENDKDRAWFERQYMRVDWSTNLNTDSYDFDTLSLIGVLDGVEYEPRAYVVEDPRDEQAPHFELDDGYFDVTTKAFAKPRDVDVSRFGWSYGTLPACFLSSAVLGGAAPVGSCNPVEITLRHSFVKLDRDGDGVSDSDYEPRLYDGQRFEHFGGFYHERYGYDRQFGLVDDEWHRILNRYNIWERSHYYAEPEGMSGWIACSSDRDCAEVEARVGFGGSRCNLFNHRCTLPYRARTPKPIPFYYTDTSNPDYFEPSELAVHEWDVALRSAVQTARYTECVRTAADEAEQRACTEEHPTWRGQMDDQQDAVQLALDIDDCRTGRAYSEMNGAGCDALADTLGDRRCVTLDDATGEKRCVSEAVRELAKMPEMLVLCHSPVAHDDPPLCGAARMPRGADARLCAAAENLPEGSDLPVEFRKIIDGNDGLDDLGDLVDACGQALRVRHGDLRYHVINVVEPPQTPSPWGIMVSSVDPVTGENIATNCNVWSHLTDMATQKIVDQMRFIKGEITAEEVTEADYVTDWRRAADAAALGGALGTITEPDRSRALSGYALGKSDPGYLAAASEGTVGDHAVTDADVTAALSIAEIAGSVIADGRIADPNQAAVQARREAAKGSAVESALITRAMLQRAGVADLPVSELVLEQASPFRGGDLKMAGDIKRRLDAVLHQRNACLLEADHISQTPVAIAPLADILEEKFGAFNPDDSLATQYERAEKMRRYLAHRLHYGVMAHEIGHSIAHRHNFAGSSNPWAYSPQYWQLRTRDGKEDESCDRVTQDGRDCVGPRYMDPETDAERDNLIHMFMTSSIMDYQGEITQDFMGPGIWDFAATRMFYGDAVSVLDEPEMNTDGNIVAGLRRTIRGGFGGLRGISFNMGSLPIHYSQLQRRIGMISDCAPVTELDAFVPGRFDEARLGRWHPVVDGRLVAPEGTYTRCRQPRVDYVDWDALSGRNAKGDVDPREDPTDARGRIMQPYIYASDNWADIGNVSVYRHDNGADMYEIFNFFITQKELSVIFDRYRRKRSDFSIRATAGRMLNRYDAKLRDGAKGLGLYRNYYEQIAAKAGLNPAMTFAAGVANDAAFESNVIAATYAFDFFARELARPEAGAHNFDPLDADPILRFNGDPYDFSSYGAEQGAAVVIPNGPAGAWRMMSPGGALLENRLADNQGEFDSEYVLNCGSYYDKILVGMLLTESVDNFISSDRSDFYDARWRSVSLAGLFPDGYRRLIGNALTNDEFFKGPRIPADADGNPLVTMVEGEPRLDGAIGWTRWWPESPTHCYPVQGQTQCGGFVGRVSGVDVENAVPIDSQIGWEQQKFLIVMSLLYLPENQKIDWLNQFMVYEHGRDPEPGTPSRIELHHPDGRTFVASTFGREEIFGRTVQKGIAARVLEYANQLLDAAYETVPIDVDGDEVVDWYEPVLTRDGRPVVRYDSDVAQVAEAGTCNDADSSGCTCDDNLACQALRNYMSVPAFMRQVAHTFGLMGVSVKGFH